MIIQGKVWGETSPLFNLNNVEIHYCKIKKGGYCSRHLHKHKYNRFVMLSGKLKVTIWKEYGYGTTLEDVSIITANQECTVNPGDLHQFEALEDCTLLEIYYLTLDERDIVRHDHGGMIHEKTPNTCNESSTGNHYCTMPSRDRFAVELNSSER